jgi:biopolymer transport protein ExbD
MTWKVRHQGSPRASDDMELAEVVQGLQDGMWETTDEVMGPQDRDWVPIESHPQLAEAAAEIEPPPPPQHDDETHLDMNPLIDVCLVLLVFFILTTTYAVLQKRLEAPEASAEKAGPVTVTKNKVEQQMVLVTIRMESGQPVTRVEDKVVPSQKLLAELRSFMKATSKTQLLLDYDSDVPEQSVVDVLDAAKLAGIERVSVVVPDKGR